MKYVEFAAGLIRCGFDNGGVGVATRGADADAPLPVSFVGSGAGEGYLEFVQGVKSRILY